MRISQSGHPVPGFLCPLAASHSTAVRFQVINDISFHVTFRIEPRRYPQGLLSAPYAE